MDTTRELAPRVLLSAIDTIYAFSCVDLADKYVEAFTLWKEHWRKQRAGEAEPLCITLAGERFRIVGGDRSFPVWLQHKRGILKLRPGKGRSTRPTVYVEMSAEALHDVDGPAGELWFWERVIMAELLGVDPLEAITLLRISRLDVHIDVAGINFTLADLDNFISRSDDDHAIRHQRRVTGLMFGKRGSKATVARIYDKLWDIECKPEGGYLLDLYGELGLQAGESAWRIEFEFRTRGLHEHGHGIYTVHEAITEANSLLRYGVEKWLWLCVPDTAPRRTRCDTDPRWKLIQDAIIGTGAEASRRITKQRNSATKELALVQSVAGCIASYGGLIDAPDFETAVRRILIRAWDDADQRGIDLDNRVREKAGDYSALAARRADDPPLYPDIGLALYQHPPMRFELDLAPDRITVPADDWPAF